MKPYIFIKSTTHNFNLKIKPSFIDILKDCPKNKAMREKGKLGLDDYKIISARRHFEYMLQHYPKYLIIYNYIHFRDQFFAPLDECSYLTYGCMYFYEIQKTYIPLRRFIQNYIRKKRYKKFNDRTLLFEPIDKSNCVNLYENNFYYSFNINEIQNMCKNIVYFYSDFTTLFKQLKNPYTNKVLDIYEIMLFYIHLKENHSVPEMFSLFCQSKFNKYEFTANHRSSILTLGIKYHLSNAPLTLKITYFNSLIRTYYPQRINVTELSNSTHKTFFDIFESLILPFLFVVFHDEPRVVNRNSALIKNRLNTFFSNNTMFGRYTMRKNYMTNRYEPEIYEKINLHIFN